MTYQIKATIVSLFTTILGSVLYVLRILSLQESGRLKLSERLTDWGSVILILIGVLIVFQLVIHVIFAIINKIVTDEDAETRTDELDKLVELKSTRNAYFTFLGGLMIGLVTMIAGQPVWIMFAIIAGSLVAGGLVGDISKLVLYRRGG